MVIRVDAFVLPAPLLKEVLASRMGSFTVLRLVSHYLYAKN